MSRYYQHFFYRTSLLVGLFSLFGALVLVSYAISPGTVRTGKAAGSSGVAYAWGSNSNGKLGNGTTSNSSSPIGIVLASGVTASTLTGGKDHSLAIGSDNKLYAWGYNASGELGDGTTNLGSTTPKVITLTAGVVPTAIAAGESHSLAIGSDNKLYAWGNNSNGRLGDGTLTNRLSPVVITLASGVTPIAIDAGHDHSLAIGSDNKLYAWGANGTGQLGDGTTTQSLSPKAITLASGVTPTAIAAAQGWSVAIGSDNKVYGWGNNAFGNLGDGSTTQRTSPVASILASGVNPTAIAAVGFHAMAIGSNGKLYTWGYNAQGQLGNGTTANSSTPGAVTLPVGVNASVIASGFFHCMLIGSDGKLYTWGRNDDGQLGNGTTVNSGTPAAITLSGNSTPLAISAGYLHSQAILPVPTPAAITFINPNTITINEANAATPYPSTLTVSGVTTTVTRVTASIYGISHTYMNDVNILLVGPGGQNTILMADVGGNNRSNINLTFDDNATSSMFDSVAVASGTYKPSNTLLNDDFFPGPAPAATNNVYSLTLSVFTGLDPNGTWKLYVFDDNSGDAGQIANGWALNFYANQPALAATGGNYQTATVGTAFSSQLQATLKDAAGYPLGGQSVTFTAPGSGASGTFANGLTTYTGTTNSSGVVTTSVFTANGVAGTYLITATNSGAPAAASFGLTNQTGVASSISVSSGNSQSSLVGMSFAQPLVAKVTDSYGNPISSATITFTAPSSGASGKFANNQTVYTGTTNASGVATATTFTANSVSGSYSVTATTSGVVGSVNFSLTNLFTTPTVQSGNNQQTIVTTNFSQPLVVVLRDNNNNLVSSTIVTFTAPSSGASGKFANNQTVYTGTTNASGVVTTTTFTANSIAGSYNVTATTASASTPASFSLVNLSTTVIIQSGTNQQTNINTAFSQPLVVLVRNSNNNPVSSATVTFTAPTSGASGTFANGLTTYVGTTNASGVITTSTFTANSTKGSYVLDATTIGASTPASFAMTNLAPPAAINLFSGGGQSQTINSTLSASLVAKVTDSSNNPVSGASVSFVAPDSGASGTFVGGSTISFGTTDANGLATAPAFTTNSIAGSYSVKAAVSGVVTTASFGITNTAGAAANLVAISGGGQSTTVGTAFSSPLVAQVTDAANNPVSGLSVVFSLPGSGAAATFASGQAVYTGTTNASGRVTTTLVTANTSPGSYTVSAAVSGSGLTPISYALTNASGSPGQLSIVSGNQQSVQVNTPFPNPLVVAVTDLFNNPLGNVQVTFTAPTIGASGTFSGGTSVVSVTTGVNGQATAPGLSANTIAGSYGVTVTVSGIATPTLFSFTNTAGAAGNLSVVEGTGQSTSVNTAFQIPLTTQVSDQYGNPVGGVSIKFTPVASGASGSFQNAAGDGTFTAVSDNTGKATASVFTANTVAGTYSVSVSVENMPNVNPVNFALANLAGQPATITVAGGAGQSATVNTAFSNPLVVSVTDQYNNPVSATLVTFSLPGSGASAGFAGGSVTATALTSANGQAASPVLTANSVAGSYSATATVQGVASLASFSLTNLTGCNPLQVTSAADDGSCGTLRVALSTAAAGSSKQVTITLAAGSTITLTTGITIGSGISVTTTAACGASGPAITIQGSSGTGLILSGGNSVYSLWVKGFSSQQIVASGGGNILYCVKSSKS